MPANPNNATPRGRRSRWSVLAGVLLLIALLVLLGVVLFGEHPEGGAATPPSPGVTSSASVSSSPTAPQPTFEPYAVTSTLPNKLLVKWNVLINDVQQEGYSAPEPFNFGLGADYTAKGVEGITTFRGDNFRDGGAYGTLDFTPGKMKKAYQISTDSLTTPDGTTYSGSGWVGQPLVMTWPKDVRAHMNLEDWAKSQDTLTEVIYATLDGKVYFFELSTGKETRPPLDLGYPFKGSGSLDPRGYPILYLGAGASSERGSAEVFVISLLDMSILYHFGADDTFAPRPAGAFISSPLVDAQTDTLIYPGDNGVLYLVRLNTSYDANGGTLSLKPTVVRWRYKSTRATDTSYWLGMAASPVVWGGYLIIADHGGQLLCVDLNTLTPKWVQDMRDDTVSSPVLAIEDGHPYIYIGTAFHRGWRSSDTAIAPIWKIDAVTGGIVWKNIDYTCYSKADSSGGVLGTIAVGQGNLSNLVFVSVAYPARMTGAYGGYLVALDKATGEPVWTMENYGYSRSSPVLVYDKDGKGYIIYCTSEGYIYLLDGLTGPGPGSRPLDSLKLANNSIEASPVIFNGMVVIGTKDAGILGIKLEQKP
ncbi:MAG: PQQ-binding-like beta-propeller repeat protein [Firmicutes bacterium]|nr:PQQ-binding-like beta-propeller repeat protein [Bacillota bacterium]